MPNQIQRKLAMGDNRKMVFRHGDLRLWLDSEGFQPPTGAMLTLERLEPRTTTAWKTLWRGITRVDRHSAYAETVECAWKKSR